MALTGAHSTTPGTDALPSHLGLPLQQETLPRTPPALQNVHLQTTRPALGSHRAARRAWAQAGQHGHCSPAALSRSPQKDPRTEESRKPRPRLRRGPRVMTQGGALRHTVLPLPLSHRETGGSPKTKGHYGSKSSVVTDYHVTSNVGWEVSFDDLHLNCSVRLLPLKPGP